MNIYVYSPKNGIESYLVNLGDEVLFWDSENERLFLLKEKMFERGPVEDWSDLLEDDFEHSYILEQYKKSSISLEDFLEILLIKGCEKDDILEQIVNEGGIDVLDGYDVDYDTYCHSIITSYSFEKLSEFDYKKKDRFVFLDCKIKGVSRPQLKDGEYHQNIMGYDDNTKFLLDLTLREKFADFDKWKKNDHIRLIGYYKVGSCFVWWINKMNPTVIALSNDIDDNVQLSRSQEVDGYDEWREDILIKDNHKCVCCGLDKHLHVHHLFGYAENPELAINENNGVTLCKFCHERYHSIYGKKNINPRDFIEYISKYGI